MTQSSVKNKTPMTFLRMELQEKKKYAFKLNLTQLSFSLSTLRKCLPDSPNWKYCTLITLNVTFTTSKILITGTSTKHPPLQKMKIIPLFEFPNMGMYNELCLYSKIKISMLKDRKINSREPSKVRMSKSLTFLFNLSLKLLVAKFYHLQTEHT